MIKLCKFHFANVAKQYEYLYRLGPCINIIIHTLRMRDVGKLILNWISIAKARHLKAAQLILRMSNI